jgi:hypothetical protein
LHFTPAGETHMKKIIFCITLIQSLSAFAGANKEACIKYLTSQPFCYSVETGKLNCSDDKEASMSVQKCVYDFYSKGIKKIPREQLFPLLERVCVLSTNETSSVPTCK